MRDNQNSSNELGLCPKSDLTHLSSNYQNNIAIEQLLAIGTRLGTTAKI
jgi:hypothetical protein